MTVLLRHRRLLLFWLCNIFGIVFRGDASWGETPVQVTEHIVIIGVDGIVYAINNGILFAVGR